MEFPDLGKHCSEKTCKQLDFLPLKCDACEQDFCKDHFTYTGHKCPFAFKKDVHVPVCPLCNVPIPIKKGAIPDVVVGEHMDRDCTNHPGKKEKVFTYRCSKEGCRKKEMLQLACAQCHGNFCILHRHPLDHGCRAGSCPASRAGLLCVHLCIPSSPPWKHREGTWRLATRTSESEPSGTLNALSCSWLARRLRWKVKR